MIHTKLLQMTKESLNGQLRLCMYIFIVLIEYQSQKTQGFCVADFAMLSDETKSRSKIFPLFTWIKEPCVRKFERLKCSKLLGISQTNIKAGVFKDF